MNIIKVVGFRRRLNAFSFLRAVVSFDVQRWINASLDDAGLFLPRILLQLLCQLLEACCQPTLFRLVAPASRVTAYFGVVGDSFWVEVTTLFQYRQVRQRLRDIHITLQAIPEGQCIHLVEAQGVDLGGQTNLVVGIAVVQPQGIVMGTITTGQQLQHGVELFKRRNEESAETPLEAKHAVDAVELAAIIGADFAVEP